MTTLDALKPTIVGILRRHDVARASLFGSVARGDSTDTSDLDILVEFEGEKSLLDLVALKLELEQALAREVDVVTYDSLHPRLRGAVLADQMPLL